MINILYSIVAFVFFRLIHFCYRCVYHTFRVKYTIHKSFRFNGWNIQMYGNGKIECLENSYVGEYSTLQAASGYKIQIGRNCQISHNVRVYTSTAVADQDFSSNNIISKYGDVIIGDYVWIGANVFINPGITIGNNAIVGANSVVSKNIEPGEIHGGVPAKLIRKKKID